MREEAIGISSIIFFFSQGDGVLTLLKAAWNCCSASMAFGDGRLSKSNETFGRTSSNKSDFLGLVEFVYCLKEVLGYRLFFYRIVLSYIRP